MIAYDRRCYYDPQKEKVYDPEWDDASAADEPEVYYWIIRDRRKSDIKVVKRYKPSVCMIVRKRTGWMAVPVDAERRTE